ncbi:DUF1127 domain-containing protein [Paracoccus litorisediminis]|uniref:DUF1127 domain-containing protein n=1 Tax=Paracoccus litorisediminis TaxID=2006130 RepID=A0A844HTE1_9RHOB|nr:DUF1127 domain-containing protein [Paracoccus litorisediminis]
MVRERGACQCHRRATVPRFTAGLTLSPPRFTAGITRACDKGIGTSLTERTALMKPRIYHRLSAWRAPRPTRCEIATLSDHMLRDIGIDPGRIRPR